MIHAVESGQIESFKLFHFKGCNDKKKPIIYLTAKEVEILSNYTFENRLLKNIKDLFLFQCFTGLSYGDIWSSWNLEITEIGRFLKGNRHKNGASYFIPLTKEAEQILKKYNYKLPIYDNGTYNRILKEIAAIVGIKKRLTSHTGRKTFATLQDSLGWSRESISKMLGHRSFKTTETYYLGDSDMRITNEILNRKK